MTNDYNRRSSRQNVETSSGVSPKNYLLSSGVSKQWIKEIVTEDSFQRTSSVASKRVEKCHEKVSQNGKVKRRSSPQPHVTAQPEQRGIGWKNKTKQRLYSFRSTKYFI